ncbi:MAG: hypothetical protein AB7U61_08590 [Methylocystis sp.]
MNLVGTPSRIAGICAIALVTLLVAISQSIDAESPSGNANAILVGPCNISQQNIAASGESTIINEIECTPQKPEDSFLLRYLWLDATTSSFLVAGRFDPALARLLPETPIVIDNPVFRKLRDLVKRFGRSDQKKDDGYIYTVSAKGSNAMSAKWTPSDERSKLRVYAGEENIVWPDVYALHTVFKTNAWPSDYYMSYIGDSVGWNRPERDVNFQNEVISCTRIYKFISLEMLNNYWIYMRKLDEVISRKKLKHDVVKDEGVSFDSLKNKTIEAMRYFGERGWPEDFLLAYGRSPDGCGGGPDFGFYAVPRRLFTLVAVIEPRRKDLQIEHVSYLADSRESLRKLEEPSEPRDSPPGVISVKRGEMAVIPLRIELRYDMDGGVTDSNTFSKVYDNLNAANKVYDRIKSLKLSTLKFTSRESYDTLRQPPPPLRTEFSKSVSSFRPPEALDVTPTYLFGTSLYLNTLRIMGSDVRVRRAPAAAVGFIGYTETGSCPFLFVSNGVDEPSRVGRVLVGANKWNLARTEEIELPRGTRSLFISEQEPEVTFMETISIKDSSSGEERLIASNIVLHPGDARQFTIPAEFSGKITLRVRGYYEPLRLEEFVEGAPEPNSHAPD